VTLPVFQNDPAAKYDLIGGGRGQTGAPAESSSNMSARKMAPAERPNLLNSKHLS
jgi:hypothetical protein